MNYAFDSGVSAHGYNELLNCSRHGELITLSSQTNRIRGKSFFLVRFHVFGSFENLN